MSMRDVLTMMLLWLLVTAHARSAPVGPGLGQPASAGDVAAWNSSIFPGGEGLPPGRGCVQQGEVLYEQHCARCHGPEGRGGAAEELAGAEHTLVDSPPDKTIGTYWPYATTVFDFIRRSMPLEAPGSLTDNEIYALTAYLLFINRVVEANAEMNAQNLPKVRMTNRDGFIDFSQVR